MNPRDVSMNTSRFRRTGTSGCAILFSAVICLLVSCQCFGAGSASEELYTLGERVLRNHAAFYPVRATDLGVHEFDGELASFTPSGVNHQIDSLRFFQSKLEAIDFESLTTDERIDYLLLRSNLWENVFDLDEAEHWRHNPAVYANECVDGIYFLLLRDFAPLEARLENAAARLSSIPRVLQEARKNVVEPPEVLVDVAVGALREGSDFILESVVSLQHEYPAVEGLAEAGEQAAAEMLEYADYLESLEDEDFGRLSEGPGLYAQLLRKKYMLPYSPDELEEIGLRVLKESTDELNRLRAEQPDMEQEEITSAPENFTREDVFAYYDAEVERVKDFILEKDYITIPEIGGLEIVETPEFLRGIIPGIAYQPPAAFDEVQTGYFYVRPVPELDDPDQRLRYYSYTQRRGFRGSIVHEAYPGHHLQLTMANQHPSKIRRLQMDLSFIEGWALYCEEMMARYGLYEELPDPGLRYLGGVRFRAARVVVDKRLHCGEYTYDEAVEFMVEQFGEDSREFIRSEVRRYCAYPTQAMSYLIGKLALMDLRRKLEANWGDGFTMKRFHDALMMEGSIPTALLAGKLLGEEIRLEDL